MDMGKNNLYGWGIFRIPMPRARIDIYADKRRGQVALGFSDRRSRAFPDSFGSILISSLREDCPALQIALVLPVALLMLLLLAYFPKPVAAPEDLPVARPVEIVTRRLAEPVVEPPPVMTEIVESPPAPAPEPAVLLPDPPAPARPDLRPPPVVETLVSLPPTRQPEPIADPVQRPVPMAAVPEVLPERTVSLAVPATVDPVSAPLAISRPAPDYSVTSEQQPLVTARVAPAPTARTPQVAVPGVAPAADYRMTSAPPADPALARGAEFVVAAAGTTVNLPVTGAVTKDFSVPQSQGGHAIARTGVAFAPQSGQDFGEIAGAGQVAGQYRSADSPTTGLPIGAASSRLVTGESASAVQLPSASISGSRTGSFSGSVAEAAVGPPGSSTRVIGVGEGAEDPDLFISLNQLNACVDQSEEDRLRTELAVRLTRGGAFPCQEMIFYIDYVETGQTVQMRIYNPRDFADKCAALSSAIECINHSR